MLNKMRNKKFVMSGAIILALAFIALVYFEWGQGGGGCSGNSGEIAKVNGRAIYMQDIKPLYEQLKERYKEQIKDNEKGVDKQIMIEAIQQIAQKYIIEEQIKKAEISVSDDEIMRNVMRRKEFLIDGKFNAGGYKMLPSSIKQKFEQDVKEELTTQLFWLRLFNLIKVSDIDLRGFFQEKYTECKINFILIPVKENTQAAEADNLLNVNQERIKAEKVMDQFLKMARQNNNFAGAAAALGLKVETTDYFSFFNFIKKEGSDERYTDIESQDIWVTAFKSQNFQISDKISVNKGFACIQLIGRKTPNWDKFYKELPALRGEYESKLQYLVQNEWYFSVAKKAKISSYIDKYYKD